jgi:signal transduction histidine kinase
LVPPLGWRKAFQPARAAHHLYGVNLRRLRRRMTSVARRQPLFPAGCRSETLLRHQPPPTERESAVYYSCLEAIQNASKQGGPAVAITVALREHSDQLTFQVTDDGPGFDASNVRPGAGLQILRDRLGALDRRRATR